MWARSFSIKGSSQTPWHSGPSSHKHHKQVTNSWCLSRKLEGGTPQPTLEEYGHGFNFIKLPSCIKPILCLKACGTGGITKFAEESGNLEPMQSAYCEAQLTETTLFKVKSDILNAMNKKEVMCLVLLDLSVAFDTMNHQLLLNHLKYHFGFQGKVIQWLESYLTGHTQKVVLENTGKTSESTPKPLKWGVPRGSVLGPILFTLYTSPLGDLCNVHGIQLLCYTGDTQLYLSLRPIYQAAKQNCIQNLEAFISEIWN